MGAIPTSEWPASPAAVAARRSACLRLNADYRPAPGEKRATNGVGAKRVRAVGWYAPPSLIPARPLLQLFATSE